jgi:hypothetical protein
MRHDFAYGASIFGDVLVILRGVVFSFCILISSFGITITHFINQNCSVEGWIYCDILWAISTK